MRIVMVGCGGMSQRWLTETAACPEADVVGFVDIDRERAENRRAEFGAAGAVAGTSLKTVLQSVNPDVVFDCTVPEAHCNVTLTALEAGCHVLGEKPMADCMSNARKMVRAAAEKDRLYAVIQNRRYVDGTVRYRELVQSGRIGPLTTLNADFYIGAHFGGFRAAMEHVLLLDMAIHTFDQARFISGADASSVYCYEWNPGGSWYRHGASAMCIFEMTNDLVFSYRGSWCSEGLNTSWECEWRAVGEKGSATWDGRDAVSAQTVTPGDSLIWPAQDLAVPERSRLSRTGHAAIIHEFLDCVRNGGTPQTVCTDNIRSLAMVHAAIESAEAGRKVAVRA